MHTNYIPDRNRTAVIDGEYVAEQRKTTSSPAGAILRPPSARPSPDPGGSDKADEKNEPRVERLLKMIDTMRSEQAFTADELARKMRVSRRTIFRDVEMLTRIGIPIRLDECGQGYRISQWHFLPPTGLNLLEVTGLCIAARKMACSGTYPLFTEAVHAIEKMAETLPPGLWDACLQMASHVEVRRPAMVDASPIRQIFQTLLKAATEHNQVLLAYDVNASHQKVRIVFHPYLLTLLGHTWCVIGYCEDNQEVQTFALDLVLSADRLAKTFDPPSDFSLDRYLGRAWTVSPEGSVSSVRLRFSPKVCDRVEDIIWHRTQRTQRLSDGSLIFEVDVDGLTEISYWILGYGDEVVVEKPAKLRTRIQQIAQKILNRYTD